jgi:hypothetical protein
VDVCVCVSDRFNVAWVLCFAVRPCLEIATRTGITSIPVMEDKVAPTTSTESNEPPPVTEGADTTTPSTDADVVTPPAPSTKI